MNLNHALQVTKPDNIGKRISDLWNSRNRIVRLTILAATGLVLNCCCVIIPLSSKANSLAPQANAGVHALAAPAFTTAQDPFIPTTLVISANTAFRNTGDGRVVWKNFNAQAAAQWATHIPLDGSDKD